MQTTTRPWYFSRTTLWAGCILAAFIATHMPPPPRPAPMVINDKILHFAGFTVIGLLTVWRLGEGGRRIHPAQLVGWFLFLVMYGLFDEATQELVGRNFEWYDWLADCAGGAFGMLVGLFCMRWDRARARARA